MEGAACQATGETEDMSVPQETPCTGKIHRPPFRRIPRTYHNIMMLEVERGRNKARILRETAYTIIDYAKVRTAESNPRHVKMRKALEYGEKILKLTWMYERCIGLWWQEVRIEEDGTVVDNPEDDAEIEQIRQELQEINAIMEKEDEECRDTVESLEDAVKLLKV